MTQEQFEALGIDRSLAKKAAEESTKELDGYVKKESYDQLDQEKKQLETSVAAVSYTHLTLPTKLEV